MGELPCLAWVGRGELALLTVYRAYLIEPVEAPIGSEDL